MTEDQRFLAEVREEQGTVFITLDDGEVLEMAPGSVPRGMPATGESISSPLLVEIRLAAERKKVARRIFGLLDRKLYPVSKLRSKLIEDGYSEAAIKAVLEQMAAGGVYSDRHFAEAFCRDCLRAKAVGLRYLEMKLREKGVAVDISRAVPAEILDQDTERELALTAARTRLGRERGTDPRKTEAKVIHYLVGRGFGVGMASKAVRRVQKEVQEGQVEEN